MPAPARRAEARRLPLRVPPVEGETFPSYVERLAADLGITLVEALAATGVIDRTHHLDIPFCAGYGLPRERVAVFATNARLAPERVAAMFLDRYAEVLQWRNIPSRAGTGTLAEARRLGVIVRSSNLCPDCISEDGGAWQASWMLVWHFACLRHRRLLADVCPSCSSFLGYGATHAIGFLSFPSLPPAPGRCGNSLRGKNGAVGRGSTPCGQPLPAIETVQLEPRSPLLAAQQVLIDLLDGRPQVIDGEENAAPEYLQELRALATLLLWTGRTEHYAEMPAPIPVALERDFTGVVNNRRWLRDLGTRSDRVHRAAGVLTAAVSLFGAPQPETLAERLEPLLRLAEKAGRGRRYPSELRVRLPPSRLVDAALQVAEAGTFRSPWRTTTARHAAIRSRRRPPRIEQVPQLFWLDLYQALFKGLVTELRDDPFRRFCSLTLAKLAGDVTWAAARAHLDLEVRGTKGQIGWARGDLRQLGNTDVFLSRIVHVADALGAADHRVDYAERRQALADLRSWPEDDCLAIVVEAGLPRFVHPRRCRNVATWLWCELTSGDYRRAPAFRDGFTNADQNSYMKFRRDIVPRLHTLDVRAERLLVERAVPAPAEAWRRGVSNFVGAADEVGALAL
ncbi:MAG: TniQ family protein [Acidimicrobiia bacterium]